MPCSDSSTGCGCHPRELVHHLPEDAGSRLPPPPRFSLFPFPATSLIPRFETGIFSRASLFLALTYLLSRFTRRFVRFKRFLDSVYRITLVFVYSLDCSRVPIFFPFFSSCERKERQQEAASWRSIKGSVKMSEGQGGEQYF